MALTASDENLRLERENEALAKEIYNLRDLLHAICADGEVIGALHPVYTLRMEKDQLKTKLDEMMRDHTESGGCYAALPRLRESLEHANAEVDRLSRQLAEYTVGDVVMVRLGHPDEQLQILHVGESDGVLRVRVGPCSKGVT